VTLGRGTAGIQVGLIVTAPGGLVGRVISVLPYQPCFVNQRSNKLLGVTISRSRYMGFLRGQSAGAVMQFFDKVPDVRRGIVSTSPQSDRCLPVDV